MQTLGVKGEIVTAGGLKSGDHARPNALFRPAVKARIGCVPFPEFSRQVAPWRARARNPEHGFKESPVIAARAARITFFARQDR